MNKEQLKRILDFLEKKEGQIHKDKGSIKWKIMFNEPLTEEELNVKGGLDLSRTIITSLPEGLKVGGGLFLAGLKITSLPEGLEVGSWLDLQYTEITSLPKGLKVDGSLYIKDTKLTKYLDDELREMIKPGFIKGKIFRD